MNTQAATPVITEKSLLLAGKGWYTFAVSVQAEKQQIASFVAKQFGVTVVDVKTSMRHGKERKRGKYQKRTRLPDWKKALVKLKSGQHIDVFETVTKEMQKAQ